MQPRVQSQVTTDKSAVTFVAFNPKSPELVATADAQGAVKIWRLSTLLSEPVPHELETLDAMASASVGKQGEEGDDDE